MQPPNTTMQYIQIINDNSKCVRAMQQPAEVKKDTLSITYDFNLFYSENPTNVFKLNPVLQESESTRTRTKTVNTR